MRELWTPPMFLFWGFLVVVVWSIYWFEFSGTARACFAAGGTAITTRGDCLRTDVTVLKIAP